jgi:Tfp pilus assembly protein FimT
MNIEKFINTSSLNYVNTDLTNTLNNNLIVPSISNDTQFTIELINGNWTCDLTTVNSNYVASNLLTITITDQNSTNGNYGTLLYNNQTYTINFILNNNLTAIVYNNLGIATSQNLHILFYNNFTVSGQENINPPFNKREYPVLSSSLKRVNLVSFQSDVGTYLQLPLIPIKTDIFISSKFIVISLPRYITDRV